MPNQNIDLAKSIFTSRLSTLEHLLGKARDRFGDDDSFLQKRIAADMLPLGTQIAFTCNQPRNFALWCGGQPMDNLNPQATSLAQAYEHIENTKQLVASIGAEDAKLEEIARIDLSEALYLELPGHAYLNEFLMPNLYFHLVTAYDILRMAGVAIGKSDYMLHLIPFVKQADAADS